MACHNVCMHVTEHGWGSHHTSHTRRHKVTQSRGNRGPDLYLHWAGIIKNQKPFFTHEKKFPNSTFFRAQQYFDVKTFWLVSHDEKKFPNGPLILSSNRIEDQVDIGCHCAVVPGRAV